MHFCMILSVVKSSVKNIIPLSFKCVALVDWVLQASIYGQLC